MMLYCLSRSAVRTAAVSARDRKRVITSNTCRYPQHDSWDTDLQEHIPALSLFVLALQKRLPITH